jgi:hypothetical protein
VATYSSSCVVVYGAGSALCAVLFLCWAAFTMCSLCAQQWWACCAGLCSGNARHLHMCTLCGCECDPCVDVHVPRPRIHALLAGSTWVHRRFETCPVVWFECARLVPSIIQTRQADTAGRHGRQTTTHLRIPACLLLGRHSISTQPGAKWQSVRGCVSQAPSVTMRLQAHPTTGCCSNRSCCMHSPSTSWQQGGIGVLGVCFVFELSIVDLSWPLCIMLLCCRGMHVT